MSGDKRRTEYGKASKQYLGKNIADRIARFCTGFGCDSEDPNAAAHFIEVSTNYYDFSGKGLMDWVPLICMILCAAAAVAAAICMRKETENSLTKLASLLSFALLADLAIVIFMPATVCGWCIAAVLIIDLAITAYQEMKMEDARKK